MGAVHSLYARNEALIAFAGLAYLDGRDVNLVKVSDLITERVQLAIYRYLPGEFNVNGMIRYFLGQDTYFSGMAGKAIEW